VAIGGRPNSKDIFVALGAKDTLGDIINEKTIYIFNLRNVFN